MSEISITGKTRLTKEVLAFNLVESVANYHLLSFGLVKKDRLKDEEEYDCDASLFAAESVLFLEEKVNTRKSTTEFQILTDRDLNNSIDLLLCCMEKLHAIGGFVIDDKNLMTRKKITFGAVLMRDIRKNNIPTHGMRFSEICYIKTLIDLRCNYVIIKEKNFTSSYLSSQIISL